MFQVRESRKERFESRMSVERLEPGCALDEPRRPVGVARGDCLDHPGITDENRDSPERDMVNPSSEDSYMWPIRGAL